MKEKRCKCCYLMKALLPLTSIFALKMYAGSILFVMDSDMCSALRCSFPLNIFFPFVLTVTGFDKSAMLSLRCMKNLS